MTDDNVGLDFASDLAALVDAPRYRPGPPCGVNLILRKLDESAPEVASTIRSMLANETVSASGLAGVLGKHHHVTSPQSISRHRRRQQHNGCRCPR